MHSSSSSTAFQTLAPCLCHDCVWVHVCSSTRSLVPHIVLQEYSQHAFKLSGGFMRLVSSKYMYWMPPFLFLLADTLFGLAVQSITNSLLQIWCGYEYHHRDLTSNEIWLYRTWSQHITLRYTTGFPLYQEEKISEPKQWNMNWMYKIIAHRSKIT